MHGVQAVVCTWHGVQPPSDPTYSTFLDQPGGTLGASAT